MIQSCAALVPHGPIAIPETDARRRAEKRFINTFKAIFCGGTETLESRLIHSALTRCVTHTGYELDLRLEHRERASSGLERLSDLEFTRQLDKAERIGLGVGGGVFAMKINGVPCIIKKIPITNIEQRHSRSTANLFDLPCCYQIGVGSLGFGAWRELAAHEMTTKWVLEGECHNFPLLYHARVLQRASVEPITLEQIKDDEEYIHYWDDITAVGVRKKALREAPADLAICMERFPGTLSGWFKDNIARGTLTDSSLQRLHYECNQVVTFMKSRGFLHFDAHSHNLLASQEHVYFSDFGLATSLQFALSPEEIIFWHNYSNYDRYYTAWMFTIPLIGALCPGDDAMIEAYLTRGNLPHHMPPEAAALARRYQPIASIMCSFFSNLRERSKSTPYPEAVLASAWPKQ